jgi:Phosphotransferase enzyme family
MHAQVRQYPIEACLEPDAVRPLLQQALPDLAGRPLLIDGLRVIGARRSASRLRNPHPLTLSYELDVRDGVTGAAEKLRFYGKVYREGASAQASHGTRALHLPQLDMLLWSWPADPGLPQLGRLLDPNQTRPWWGEAAHEVSALRYEPEQRATLRYSSNAAHGPARCLYAKTFNDACGEALNRRFAYFWDQALHDSRSPGVAQPLGYCAATRAFWQAQAAGIPLQQALPSAHAAKLPAHLARAIAAVHAAPIALAGAASHDTAHWQTEIRRRHKKIVRAAPALAQRVERVAGALEQTAVLFPQPPLKLIHGDFHPGQVWLDAQRVVLFDFDEFTLGDPMEDVAAFVARLGTVTRDPAFAAQFVAAYKRIAPAQYCPLRLQWHQVVQQLLQVSRAFVFQVPDWRLELERRLAHAEALCQSTAMAALS